VSEEKINNSLDLDYPPHLLNIIVVSDGSTDRTNEILSRFQSDRLRVIYEQERKGKNQAFNRALELARGDVIVFTDANTMFAPEAVRFLVRGFADPRVGCVVGKLIYRNPKKSLVGNVEHAYWTLDNYIKEWEGRLNCLMSANGPIFAIRRSLWEPLDDVVHEDFIIPVRITLKGYFNIYEPRALAFEESTSSARQEFIRRSRIIWKGWEATWRVARALRRRFHPMLAFEIFSRQIIKRLVWLFGLTAFIVTLFLLSKSLYRIIFCLELLFLFSALAGWCFRKKKGFFRVFYYPYTIFLLAAASLIGFVKFAIGEKPKGVWAVQRPLE